MDELKYFDDLKDISPYHLEIERIYVSNGWGTAYPLATIEQMFKNSRTTVVTRHGQVVALARVFTDSTTVTHVSEIIVHKDCQQQGIGSALLSRLAMQHRHTTIYADVMSAASAKLFEKGQVFSRRPQLNVYAAHANPVSG